jgi:hypothetical protein
MQSSNSYYGYTAAITFWYQDEEANGYDDSDDWMRLLWIKVSGHVSTCTKRVLEISGVTGGEPSKFEVYNHGSSTPTGLTQL